MNFDIILAFGAACLSAALALAAIFRNVRSLAAWCFALGMLIFALESVLTGTSFLAESANQAAFRQTLVLVAKSFLPGVWLCFSLVYSRANYREFLARSRLLLAAAFLLPFCWLAALRAPLFEIASYEAPVEVGAFQFREAANILNAAVLISMILILMNLERTFRSAVGTMRWQIKFPIIGLVVIFGTRIYAETQSLLFSGYSLADLDIKSVALLIGSALIAVGYFRSGLGEIDLYPSRAVLQTSITVILAGTYLFVVGVLAQLVARFGGASSFPVAAFLVLLALAVLALLLLSERLRQTLQLFVSRHFRRPQHDFRHVWARFAGASSALLDEENLGTTAARLISDTFGALSVSLWLVDAQRGRLIRTGSTFDAKQKDGSNLPDWIGAENLSLTELRKDSRPFKVSLTNRIWPECLNQIAGGRFRTGGDPVLVPLITGDQWFGMIVLADRVRGMSYTAEEMDLLKCIGDQITANFLNIRLTQEIMERKELEAFQTISAFFVHDLKNAASTLGLMLQNLPVHFDDPAFRQDAFRGIENTAGRINDLIDRMNAFRNELRPERAELDLSALLTETLGNLNGTVGGELVTNLVSVPSIMADRAQLQSVITNLVLNARDALGPDGRITVETGRLDDWVTFSVCDNGCGMSEDFVKSSLFRPFQTSKKKGLGIGMFQAKMIVEAHGGNIQVTSSVGSGTTFRVLLPPYQPENHQ